MASQQETDQWAADLAEMKRGFDEPLPFAAPPLLPPPAPAPVTAAAAPPPVPDPPRAARTARAAAPKAAAPEALTRAAYRAERETRQVAILTGLADMHLAQKQRQADLDEATELLHAGVRTALAQGVRALAVAAVLEMSKSRVYQLRDEPPRTV
jgi:hypothetical protein